MYTNEYVKKREYSELLTSVIDELKNMYKLVFKYSNNYNNSYDPISERNWFLSSNIKKFIKTFCCFMVTRLLL